jgi:hypothetical protein
VVCPACDFRSTVPATAIGRNQYFCSSCGKAVDLVTQVYRPPATDGAPGQFAAAPRRDRGNSKYKSARKGRR